MAAALGMTRAAIWKHIQALREQGVQIEASAGQGYCITDGLILLDQSVIQSVLPAGAVLEVMENVDSTNNHLMRSLMQQHPERGEVRICMAEQQQQGRGTRGRHWLSPFAQNIYLSLLWRFEQGPAALGGLSLAIGVAVVRTLKESGVEAAIKWPNDIYTAAGKLGGILLDMSAESGGPSHVVIGIGLNVSLSAEQQEQIDQAVDSLHQHNTKIDRNTLAASLIHHVMNICEAFAADGFCGLIEEWQRYDLTWQQQVTLQIGEQQETGKAIGVNEHGAIGIEQNGQRRYFSSGDVSLRMKP